MKFIIIAVVVFIGIIILAIRFGGKNRRFPWFEFYSRGRKEGFSFKEIGFLRKISVQNRLKKPQSIFWSTRQLDRCLRPAIQKINADEDMSAAYKISMTSKLLELRKKAEFNLPKYQKRIRDTNALLPRQKLVVRDKTYGTFVSFVIENNRRYLVISQPQGQKAAQNLNWTGRKIDVYFWRQDDAGYEFDTKVQEQIVHEEYPLLYLHHSTKLARKQKRDSVRIEAAIRARFYPVVKRNIEGTVKAGFASKGHVARIVDLSETGCAMIAGRGMKKNDRIKLDFFLTDDKRIVLLGIIVNMSKTGDERVERYHIMFVKIGPQSKNNILLYVYNIFGERKEDDSEKRKKIKAAPAKKEA